jgi:tetratricopeptide (TPR) repeat protein
MSTPPSSPAPSAAAPDFLDAESLESVLQARWRGFKRNLGMIENRLQLIPNPAEVAEIKSLQTTLAQLRKESEDPGNMALSWLDDAQDRLHHLLPRLEHWEEQTSALKATQAAPTEAVSPSLQILRLIQEGLLGEASSRCRRITNQEEPGTLDWNVWTTLGLAYFEQQNFAEAIRCFKEACQLDTDAFESFFNLGCAYHEKGDWPEALECYRKAEKLDHLHPKLLCNWGTVCFQLGQLDEAAIHLTKAVELMPDYIRAWDNLSSVYITQAKWSQALAASTEVTLRRQDRPEDWSKQGLIAARLGNIALATQAFQTSLKSQPHGTEATCGMARLAIDQGDLDKAWTMAQNAANWDGTSLLVYQLWIEIGLGFSRQINFKRAGAALQRAARLQPRLADAWLQIGHLYVEQANWSFAHEYYQKAVEAVPDHYEAWYQLGRACMTLMRDEEAGRALEKARELKLKEKAPLELLLTLAERADDSESADRWRTQLAALSS